MSDYDSIFHYLVITFVFVLKSLQGDGGWLCMKAVEI